MENFLPAQTLRPNPQLTLCKAILFKQSLPTAEKIQVNFSGGVACSPCSGALLGLFPTLVVKSIPACCSLNFVNSRSIYFVIGQEPRFFGRFGGFGVFFGPASDKKKRVRFSRQSAFVMKRTSFVMQRPRGL